MVRLYVPPHYWPIRLLKRRRLYRDSQSRKISAHAQYIHKTCCSSAQSSRACLVCNNIISRRAALIWPPRSLDLNAPDYYLWGYQKEGVYINSPENLEDLKDDIRRNIRAISPATIRSVKNNALVRARSCIAVEEQPRERYYLPQLVDTNLMILSLRWMRIIIRYI